MSTAANTHHYHRFFLFCILLHCVFSKDDEEVCNENLTCQNGGSCHVVLDPVQLDVCVCPSDYMGIDCSIPAPSENSELCSDDYGFCLNGGTCNTNRDSDPKMCNCPSSYTGRYCELEANSATIQAHVKDKNKAIEESCTLSCENGGKCEFGLPMKSSKDHNITHYQHCQCPHDTKGYYCEKTITICGYDDDRNVEHYCHNNATCIDTVHYMGVIANDPSLLDSFPPYMCNCTAATEAHPGQYFTGPYCEYSDLQVCNKDDPHADSFVYCHNKQGTCVEDENDDGISLWVCDCAAGFTGTHCEKRDESGSVESQETTTTNNNETCKTITCLNGGKCIQGLKDTSHTTLGNMIKRPNEDDLSHILDQDPIFNKFEHCRCPSGYTGYNCQYEFQACPSGEHVCFHGSTCVDDEAKCSCNEDGADGTLAGKFCQHQATVKCGDKSFRYCFNGASCDQFNCRCAEGYRGPNCQFSEKVVLDDDDLLTEAKLTENHLDRMNPNLIVASGAIALFGIIFIIIAVAMTDHHREEHVSSSESTVPTTETEISPPPSVPPSSFTTKKNDQDPKSDNKFEDIELI